MSSLEKYRDPTGTEGHLHERITAPLPEDRHADDRRPDDRRPDDRRPDDRRPDEREPVPREPEGEVPVRDTPPRDGSERHGSERHGSGRLAAGAPAPRLVVPKVVWLCVVVAVLIVATALGARLVMGGLASLNPFKGGFVQQRTVDRSGPAVLKAVTDLGTLQSASGYYEVVIDVEQDVEHVPSFLAGRRVLFVAAGTVDASVDLKSLAAGAVTVNDARTAATVRLPEPRLSQPHLDLDRSYVYNEERGLIDRIGDAASRSPEDQKRLYTMASQRLAQAAATNDELVGRAETNARGVLQGLLRPLGFTEVTVTFAR